MGLFGSKSMEDMEEEDSELDLKLSIAQKKAMIKELKNRGQNPADFKERGGFNFGKIWNWLRSH